MNKLPVVVECRRLQGPPRVTEFSMFSQRCIAMKKVRGEVYDRYRCERYERWKGVTCRKGVNCRKVVNCCITRRHLSRVTFAWPFLGMGKNSEQVEARRSALRKHTKRDAESVQSSTASTRASSGDLRGVTGKQPEKAKAHHFDDKKTKESGVKGKKEDQKEKKEEVIKVKKKEVAKAKEKESRKEKVKEKENAKEKEEAKFLKEKLAAKEKEKEKERAKLKAAAKEKGKQKENSAEKT